MFNIIKNFAANNNISNGKKMPESIPGLANLKHDSWSETKGDVITSHFQTRIVAGGVGMDMKIDNVNFERVKPIDVIKNKTFKNRKKT